MIRMLPPGGALSVCTPRCWTAGSSPTSTGATCRWACPAPSRRCSTRQASRTWPLHDCSAERTSGPVVARRRDQPLKIYAPPIKKTGLLESRDGTLRESYHMVRCSPVCWTVVYNCSCGRPWRPGPGSSTRRGSPQSTRPTSGSLSVGHGENYSQNQKYGRLPV